MLSPELYGAVPQGPALVLLNAIGKEPATVLRILGSRKKAA